MAFFTRGVEWCGTIVLQVFSQHPQSYSHYHHPDGHISTDSTENMSTYSERNVAHAQAKSHQVTCALHFVKRRFMPQNPTPTVLAWFTAAPDANSAATTALWPLALAAYSGVAPSFCKEMHGHPSLLTWTGLDATQLPTHSGHQRHPCANETATKYYTTKSA